MIYIRQGDAKSLGELADLVAIVETPFFRSLGSATLTSNMLFTLLTSEAASAIANYVAYLIGENKIHSLAFTWVIAHYGVLADNVDEYGIDADELLTWLNAWDKHFEAVGKDIGTADPRLLGQVFESQADCLPVFKTAACEYLASVERAESEWLQIILDGKPGYRTVMNALRRKQTPIEGAPAIKDSVIDFLNRSGQAVEGFELTSARVESINAALGLLDAGLKSLIGIQLRTLIFSEGAAPENLVTILSEYGKLIPDMQPSSTQEVGKLISILHFISREPSSTSTMAAFFDSKAEQIAAYRYSPELRKAMGGVIAKLPVRAPALFKQFAETRGFIGMLKGLRDRKSESEA